MAAAVAPSFVWLVFVRLYRLEALAWRVPYAFGHVIVPGGEACFVACHALAAVSSHFPLRSGNFGVF